MTVAKIRAALEKQLLSITPSISTAFENTTFTPPANVIYQRAVLLPNTPEDSQISSGTYFERGIFQVSIYAPIGKGAGDSEARAQLIKNAFKRGTSLVQAGVTVIITNAPSVATGYPDGDRYITPISMRYQSQITVT